jgi:hypothetical protein
MTGMEPIWIGAAAKGLTDIVGKSVSAYVNAQQSPSQEQDFIDASFSQKSAVTSQPKPTAIDQSQHSYVLPRPNLRRCRNCTRRSKHPPH